MIKVLVIITALNGVPSDKYTISDQFILIESLLPEVDGYNPILYDIINERKYIFNGDRKAVVHRVEPASNWESWSEGAVLINQTPINSKFSDNCLRLEIEQTSIFGATKRGPIRYLELCDLPILYNYLPRERIWLSQFFFSRMAPMPFAQESYPFVIKDYPSFLEEGGDVPPYSNIESINEGLIESDFFESWLQLPVINELEFYGREWVKSKIVDYEHLIPRLLQEIATSENQGNKTLHKFFKEEYEFIQTDLSRLRELLGAR